MLWFFIAIVAVIVCLVHISESKHRQSKKSADYEVKSKKTNAKLERNLLDAHMKDGMSFENAYQQTLQDIVVLGFQPCIPRSAYTSNCGRTESSFVKDPRVYDSSEVKFRRAQIIQEQRRANPNAIPIVKDSELYQGYPQNQVEYDRGIKANTLKLQAVPVGELVTYPGYGTCEVIGHKYSSSGLQGTYSLRVVQTGEVITQIKIGDKQIRRG